MPEVEGLEDPERSEGRADTGATSTGSCSTSCWSARPISRTCSSIDGDSGILLEQKPEPEVWDTIRQDWDRFMDLVRTDRPPPLTERDTVVRTDETWQAAARRYLALKAEADAAASRLDEAKAKLIGLAQHSSEKGFGVSVVPVLEDGHVDYKQGAGAGWHRPGAVPQRRARGGAGQRDEVAAGQGGAAAMPPRLFFMAAVLRISWGPVGTRPEESPQQITTHSD